MTDADKVYKHSVVHLILCILMCLLLCALSGCATTEVVETQGDGLDAGFTFDEAHQRDVGLLIAPSDSVKIETDLSLLFGENMMTAISESLSNLSLTSTEAMVVYNSDGTLRYGASLVYLSDEDDNLSLEISLNPDGSVITGNYYYIDEDPYVDTSSEKFGKQLETIPDFIKPNNIIGDVDVWLGHTVQYGADEQGNKIELDVFVGSFSLSNNNYVVESIGLSQTEFLEVVFAMLTS